MTEASDDFDRETAKFKTHLRIRNSDTDQFRHINNAAIASFFEEARMAIFQQKDMVADMQDKNVVVVHLAIDFIREIFYPGTIDVWTAHEHSRKTSFALTQGLYVDDSLCARAKAVCVLMDSKLGKPLALPDVFRQKLTS